MAKGRRYTEEEKRSAVAAYVICGTIMGAARATGFPRETIQSWKDRNSNWWDEIEAEIWDTHEDSLRAGIHEIIVEGLKQGFDRVQNGDERVTTKGEKIRVLMSGKDINIMTGTMYDKLNISRGRPTSISAAANQATANEKLEALKKAARQEAIEHGDIPQIGP